MPGLGANLSGQSPLIASRSDTIPGEPRDDQLCGISLILVQIVGYDMFTFAISVAEFWATAGIIVLIVCLRIVDVSAGVLRVMFIMRGRRGIASAVGFIESLTWLIAAAAVFASLDTPAKAIAYAGGFALGTWVGTWLEAKLAVGKSVVRVFVPEHAPSPTDELREAGFGVTEIPGHGLGGPVAVLFCVVARRRAKDVMKIVASSYPEAFATVENIDTLDLSHRRYQPSRV